MSSLVDLPEEILIIIIKQLDIKSIYNLFQSCGRLRDIILMQGVIRKCNLSCNTLASSNSLQLNMIKGISGHLHELNMCGVSNLRKSTLTSALKRMKCLRTLDVSFTSITIFDMLDIYPICTTIKNLTMSFSDDVKLVGKTLRDCQELFKNFLSVHFILMTRFSNLPLLVLEKACLETLKLTLCDAGGRPYLGEINTICPFKHLCLFMVNSSHINASQGTWNEYLPLVKVENIEYIILEYNASYSVCTSPLFNNFFSENFKIPSHFSFDKDKELYGTVAIMIWDKQSTKFDETFFSNLKTRVKKILAFEIIVSCEQTLPSNVNILNYDWFRIHQMETRKNVSTDTEPQFKKSRTANTEKVLDYDIIFSEHKKIKLSVNFPNGVIVTLSTRNMFLNKITYLSLSGTYIHYSNEFFNVLFRSCYQLITLNVEAPSLTPCHSSIARCIPLTQSLKNIRLVDKRIDFKTLFSSFTLCRTLENICMIDTSTARNDLADLTALYQCVNLYNLHIQALVSKSTMTRMNILNKTLLKNCPDHYVNFTLEYYNHVDLNNYNPHLDVFKLDPIKPV